MVGEAENRVERLRSLYDQYFMGIERIEPQVARKDVERRIQMLRKVQIRNTALRFRFQNVVLRYNTFSAHWMRICRQIEEGTYKHHLRKAKERFDPLEAARESREARRKAAALEYGDTEPPPAPSFDVMEDLEVEFEEDPVDRPETRAALRSYAIPTDVVAPSVAGRAIEKMSAPSPPRRDASLDKRTDPAPPPAGVTTIKAPPPPRAPVPPLGRPATPRRAPVTPGRKGERFGRASIQATAPAQSLETSESKSHKASASSCSQACPEGPSSGRVVPKARRGAGEGRGGR